MKKCRLWIMALSLFCILSLWACKGAYDTGACYNEIQKKYPNSIIVAVESFSFVVKTPEDKVFFVHTGAVSSPQITKEIYCFSIGK